MKKSLKILTFFLLFILTTLSFAQGAPEPAKCPDISIIQSVGIIDIQKNPSPWVEWSTGVISNTFGTDEAWTFFIAVDKANDANDAKNIASKKLALLNTLPIGPNQLNGHWICIYFSSVDSEVASAAATPAYDHLPPITLK